MHPPQLRGSYLVLELANRCSLACVHCAVADETHPHFSGTGYLDAGLAASLFSDLERHGIHFDTLILFWLGEPLLHPDFCRIWSGAIQTAVRAGTFGKVEVHTNATHLSPEITSTVLNHAALDQTWHFSIDAATQATYTTIKGRDRFGLVEDNIDHFLDQKAATGAPFPRPVFQYIVGSNNAAEAGSFRDRWETACTQRGIAVRSVAGHVPAGDDAIVFFRQLDCPTAEEQELENAVFRSTMAEMGLEVPEQGKNGEVVRAANQTVCSGFWKSPVIDWTGGVTTCTRDSEMHNRVGSIADTPFSELWFGELMRGRRTQVACGSYSGMKVCESCFIPQSLNYTGISLGEIEAMRAWEMGR